MGGALKGVDDVGEVVADGLFVAQLDAEGAEALGEAGAVGFDEATVEQFIAHGDHADVHAT